MSCSTTSVWPFSAAKKSAVTLPIRQLPGEKRAADAVATRVLPFVVLDVEGGAGGDELLDHERVALHRGQDERSDPAEKSVAPFRWRADAALRTRALPFVALDVEVGAGVD
jgi:hypothetical protein